MIKLKTEGQWFTLSQKVYLWPNQSWYSASGEPFLYHIWPCSLLIMGESLQKKVIVSVPLGLTYLLLENRITHHFQGLASGTLSYVGRGCPAAISICPLCLPLYSPANLHQWDSLTLAKAWTQPILEGWPKHSWCSLNSQRGLTEIWKQRHQNAVEWSKLW